MSVEVRQMVIKSTVLREDREEDGDHRDGLDIEELKAEILSECKQVILETLRERRER